MATRYKPSQALANQKPASNGKLGRFLLGLVAIFAWLGEIAATLYPQEMVRRIDQLHMIVIEKIECLMGHLLAVLNYSIELIEKGGIWASGH